MSYLRADLAQQGRPRDRRGRRTEAAGILLLGVGLLFSFATVGGQGAPPAFRPASDGGFSFDTGLLRGRLRADGKSLGLQEVVYLPTGQRIDRSNGLLGHYRVFTTGKRYGGGAWDWTSSARLTPDGIVEVTWPAQSDRPFEMQARYRWCDATSVELETTVKAEAALRGFESFVASYFHPAFTNALVCAPGEKGPQFVAADQRHGDWQFFPRDAAAIALIQDGRWQLEPDAVVWTVREPFAYPLVRRRTPASGLSGILAAPAQECFAIGTPHQTEGHLSAYFSLFGRDLEKGQTARARVRLIMVMAKPDSAVLALYESALKEWEQRP